ncbi:hypothetical protein [Burkholderia pseudomallei]|uniref:hypothetical protein n=1 Tax=Burkholderia pseudomallei TaxID=28450 RepID=UPI001E3117C9|nr:hypothetical protein [Burkholderia pseudomallei]
MPRRQIASANCVGNSIDIVLPDANARRTGKSPAGNEPHRAAPVGNASLPARLRAFSNRLTGGTPANGAEAPCARSLDGLLGDVRDRSLSATESR